MSFLELKIDFLSVSKLERGYATIQILQHK